MLRLYPTKKYEVVNVEWPVVGTAANAHRNDEEGLAPHGAQPSRPSLPRSNTSNSASSIPEAASETSSNPTTTAHEDDRTGLPGLLAQAWWREWQVAIWNAVLSGKKGWVTVEDWMEAKMGVREIERGRDWGVDYE